MDDLHRGTCTELERLAAAAATMDYSESLAAAPPLPVTTPAAPVLAATTPQFHSDDHFQRQYHPPRQETHNIRVVAYDQGASSPHRAPPPPPPSTHNIQLAPPAAHAHHTPQTTIQYITSDRTTTHYGRTAQCVTTAMVEMQYPATPHVVVETISQPEPQQQYQQQPPPPPPPPEPPLDHHQHQHQHHHQNHHHHPQHSVSPSPPTPLVSTKEKKRSLTSSSGRKRKAVIKDQQEGGIMDEEGERGGDKDPSGLVELPTPVTDAEGNMVYPCGLCWLNLSSPEAWQQHATDHAASASRRRNGLSLEVKIEIIKRINSGEKQSDMAEEYKVNRSTIKSIMKKSSSYLQCWKKGMFHPDSKRLKGPKREDIEAALYSWYRQAVASGTPVSGPILCSKALAFATKLGHTDFKATHGWLDRFKKRKNIVFGRAPARRKREEEENSTSDLKPGEWQTGVLQQLLMEYEPGDIFAVDEIGLLYRTLPSMVPSLSGERCAGGIRSRIRLTVLLCGNMTGTEKFPLLVVGKHPKPSSFRHVKSLPVQYLANQKAWMTSDSFGAWLQDVDSWFVQQGRRVVVIASYLPIHSKPPGGLRSVRLVTAPQGFLGPLHHGVVVTFKRNYRRGILETLVAQLQRDDSPPSRRPRRPDTNLSLLTCLHQLANAWHSITDGVISASFTRAGVSKYGAWGAPPPPPPDPALGAENLTLLHRLRTLGLPIPDMTFDDYVHFDDAVQTCCLNNDDDILAVVTGADRDDDDDDDDQRQHDDIDDDEVHGRPGDDVRDGVGGGGVVRETTAAARGPSPDQVEAALSTLRRHIQYQEGAQEMFRILAHLEYLIYKCQGGRKGVGVQPTAAIPTHPH